jgi:hypothetical protein
MKRLIAIAALSAGLASGPVLADRGDSESRFTIGFSVGDTVADNYYSGKRSRWQSPRYRDRDRSWGHRESRVLPINGTFAARTTSNVRAGPGTRFHVTDRLHRHERVQVVGRVQGRNWYMIRNHGRSGFVYAPLLRPAHNNYRGSYDYRRDDDRWRHRKGWYQ